MATSYFNPRSPHGERPAINGTADYPTDISTHAPRTGSDYDTLITAIGKLISTHAPRTGSDGKTYGAIKYVIISTHAPRTGSDECLCAEILDSDISTHAPRTGSDAVFSASVTVCSGFQPTLPARGATGGVPERHRAPLNFNPRSPHGERHGRVSRIALQVEFQPTLPARGATRRAHARKEDTIFQPTLPARGATSKPPKTSGGFEISTHAPRTGSDGGVPERHRAPLNFNPRSPHGERHAASCRRTFVYIFQPTLPARGATRAASQSRQPPAISTHAPRTGSDRR